MIQVINRAMDILELIAKNPEHVRSLTEIADSLNLNHATCANIIKTLVNRKYVEQVGHKKGYRLGSMSYALTNNYSYKRDLVQAAKEPMEALTKKINENSLLAIIKDNKRILLYDVPSDQDLQVRTSLEKNAYEAATGRLLLAFFTGKERDAFISKYGLPTREVWEEAESREDLYAQLDRIQQEGMAVQVTNKHIIGIAIPVKKAGQVVASLGVFLPEFRFTGSWKNEIIHSLKATAEQINKKLSDQ